MADLHNIREGIKANIVTSSVDDSSRNRSKAVIALTLQDSNIPAEERGIDRLMDEGTTLIFAGTETTARALSVAFFHLLDNPNVIHQLRSELAALSASTSDHDSQHSLHQLEQLPYLTGVVQESFRLSFGAVGRLPRVATHDALRYGSYSIPPGTPISQSAFFVHTDPTVFPNPHTFSPERWTQERHDGVPLTRYLVSFTKGSRQCLGIP
nr:hypothetical protein [Zymoseptoria tritici]